MTDTDRDTLAEALFKTAVLHEFTKSPDEEKRLCERLAGGVTDWLAAHDAAVTARAHAPARALADAQDAEAERDGRYPGELTTGQLRAAIDPAAATRHDTDTARQTLTKAARDWNLNWPMRPLTVGDAEYVEKWLNDRAAALGQPHGQTGNNHE